MRRWVGLTAGGALAAGALAVTMALAGPDVAEPEPTTRASIVTEPYRARDWPDGAGRGCPSGLINCGGPPTYGGRPGVPIGDPTPAAALARMERLIVWQLSQPEARDTLAVARRQGRTGQDEAAVLLLRTDGLPVAGAEVERAADGSWTLAGHWSCSP